MEDRVKFYGRRTLAAMSVITDYVEEGVNYSDQRLTELLDDDEGVAWISESDWQFIEEGEPAYLWYKGEWFWTSPYPRTQFNLIGEFSDGTRWYVYLMDHGFDR